MRSPLKGTNIYPPKPQLSKRIWSVWALVVGVRWAPLAQDWELSLRGCGFPWPESLLCTAPIPAHLQHW